MPGLRELYERLGAGICSYRTDDGVNRLTLLRDGREGREGEESSHHQQQFSLTEGASGYAGVEVMVAYSGNRGSMLRTLEALHLPKSWSKHHGQKPFHLLLGQLQLRGASEGPLELQVTIVLRAEKQLNRLEQMLRLFHAEYK